MSPYSIKAAANDGVEQIEADHSANPSDETHTTPQAPTTISPPPGPSTTQTEEKPGAPVPYTVFASSQKRLITLYIGTAMFFSPLTANIYSPLLPALELSMCTTLQLLNLTITACIVLQGLSPLLFGDLADTVGHRPVYLLTLTIYNTASLGLALNRTSYAALLALRMLQSAGCSATAAVSYGVLATMVAANLGPSFGPLVGGVLSDRAGWPWAFWFLLITGGSFLLVLFLFFPETARSIVGNGSVPAPHHINRPPLFFPRRPGITAGEEKEDGVVARESEPNKLTFRLPNPFKSLKIVFYRGHRFGLMDECLGVSYLSIGTGVAAGAYTNGKFPDINYRTVAKQIGFTINKVSGDDLRTFPIERARARFTFYLVAICTGLLVGYGWALEQHIHISVPLMLQFLLGFITTCTVQTLNTLLVDIFPASPSTAAASGSLDRCTLSANDVAAMQPLLHHLGKGWFFTGVGLISGITSVGVTLGSRTRGMIWRNARPA